jgi:putative ABC transport system permease protein
VKSWTTPVGSAPPMFLFELISEALRNLSGEGARREILEQIQQLGIRNIIINARKPPEEQNIQDETETYTLRYGLTFRDAEQIRQTLPLIDAVLPVHDVEKWIWFKSRRIAAKVRGVTPDYSEHLRLEPFLGRPLETSDNVHRRRVCMIRSRLLREARYVGDPLKLDLKIGPEYFRVVGVLPDTEFQSPNRAVLGIDDRAMEVYVPFDTIIDRFGLTSFTHRSGSRESTRVELHQLVCAVNNEENVLDAARAVQAIMLKLHEKKDYEITVPLELLQSQQRTQQVFNIVLPIIAGISLLVGGIGILNIMLASITERTAEIGVRRAIGASGWDITWQFLIETVTLAMIGGLLGVGLGIGGVAVLKQVTHWQVIITPWALVLAMSISCLTGIVFGIYPARRAAAMDPIAALRHE